MKFNPLEYRDEIYEIYRIHSRDRFDRETDREEFIDSFYTPSCQTIQSEYYLEDRLIGVGFLDRSDRALSSVYFVYDTACEEYRLGTYSAIKEIQYAAEEGLEYYYLGYYIAENSSMAYKNRFRPNERFDWSTEIWKKEEQA